MFIPNLKIYRPLISLLILNFTPAGAYAQQADGYQQGVELADSVDSNVAVDPDSVNQVPNYTADPSQTQYYNNSGQMETDGATMMQDSDIGQFVSTDEDTRPVFQIDTTNDPMIQRATDAATNADAITGTYTGCTKIDQVTPGTTTTEACQEYRPPETHTCERPLNVTVEPVLTPTCPSGTWFASGVMTKVLPGKFGKGWDWGYDYAMCNPTRTDGLITIRLNYEATNNVHTNTCDIPLTPATPLSSDLYNISDKKQFCGTDHYYSGGCDASDNCTFRFHACFPSTWCDADTGICWTDWKCWFQYKQDLTFTRPRIITTYNVSDAWDNGQCATFEARVP